MRIRNVDIPAPLLQAHAEGQLVLFIGAGASIGAPSNLPSFGKLADDLASLAMLPRREGEREDELLGRLEDSGFDVVSNVVLQLDRTDSQPNALHTAIAALAGAGPRVRVVTTNFDPHLSTTMNQLSALRTEFCGPALPLGDDFEGLVYLHGRLGPNPRLVITDRHFGKAYLTDAWAARFLERMFSKFTVLFIGYSHNDVIMRYLARGLSESVARYVFTQKPTEATWKQLGLHPIGYEVHADSHHELTDGIAGWARWQSMGFLEHKTRIAELTNNAPSDIPEDVDYLETVLADAEKVPLFTSVARGEEWLTWASTQPSFKNLFNPRDAGVAVSWPLACWFAEHFAFNEQLSGYALQHLAVHDQQLSPTLWSALCMFLHKVSQPKRPLYLRPWVPLIVQSDPQLPTEDWLEYALVATDWDTDRESGLLLLEHLVAPRLTLQRSFSGHPPRPDIAFAGDAYWLNHVRVVHLRPRLGTDAQALLNIATRSLAKAHQLLLGVGVVLPGWDPLSFRVSGVSSELPENVHDSLNVVVQLARDCLVQMLTNSNVSAEMCLTQWAAGDIPLLRRLSIDAWANRDDVSADVKIAWLAGRRWFFDHQLISEAYRLLELALPGASSNAVDHLVDLLLLGPEGDVEGLDVVSDQLRWLYKILACASHHGKANDAFAALAPGRPELAAQLAVDEKLGVPPIIPPPLSATALTALLSEAPQDAVDAVEAFRASRPPTPPFHWHDALLVLTEAVRAAPEIMLSLLDDTVTVATDVLEAGLRGVAAATLHLETMTSVVTALSKLHDSSLLPAVARLLSEGGRSEEAPNAWQALPESRDLANKLWQQIPVEAIGEVDSDWLTTSVSQPAGQLAQFWANAVAMEWRENESEWSGLTHDLRGGLDLMLGGEGHATALAQVFLASQVHFFHRADRAWCEARVLPLLDWSEPERARRCWDGFLFWGRFDLPLLEAGMMSHYLGAVGGMADAATQLKRQLASHLAEVALLAPADLSGWLCTLTATAEESLRVEFAEQVAWRLGRRDDEAAEAAWAHWMQSYWEQRLAGAPRTLSDDEAQAMLEWPVRLTKSLHEAVGLATSRPAALPRHGFLNDLTPARLQHGPDDFAHLVAHGLSSSQAPFHGTHYLRTLVPTLREMGASAHHLAKIVDEALRLGIPEASSW